MTKKIHTEELEAHGVAFCDDTKNVIMDLANSNRTKDDQLESAWGLIANASGGDWDKESKEWKEAAEKWRDNYHPTSHDESIECSASVKEKK